MTVSKSVGADYFGRNACQMCIVLDTVANGAAGYRLVRHFLRKKMPYKPITSGAIRHRIQHYAHLAGISAKIIGAHAFRHSHAAWQVDAGANIKVVSDILGHRSSSSTSIYVRVALRRLRTVALSVPR